MLIFLSNVMGIVLTGMLTSPMLMLPDQVEGPVWLIVYQIDNYAHSCGDINTGNIPAISDFR